MSSHNRDTSQRRNKNYERLSFESRAPTPSHSKEEQLDILVHSILSRTLTKFDAAQDKSPDTSQTKRKDDEQDKHTSPSPQNSELARLVLGQAAQFALNQYLKSRRKKAAKRAADAREQAKTQLETQPKQSQMPFLFGGGGRPIGSGERERMQRRRESSRSAPYDSTYNSYNTSHGASYSSPYTGNEEIHLTDPLPPEPVPVAPPSTYLPPRDPAPEPKLRRRRRHHNLSGRDKDAAVPESRPPPVIPPSPERHLSPQLPRSYTWDSTPNYPQAGTGASNRYGSYDRPQSRSPYLHHPNYPMHDGYTYSPQPEPRRRRTGAAIPTSPADLPTPPISPYIPSETPREQQRRRESERDAEREQRRRDREYDKDRRQRKGEGWPREREADRGSKRERLAKEKERLGKERERERVSLERSREAALALSLDDFLVQIRKTDDIVYRNMYRPLVDKYDERRDRGRDREREWERCSCRSIIMQSGDLQRSLARSRSSAHAVRDLLDVPLVEDRRRRRRSTVHFASEQTM